MSLIRCPDCNNLISDLAPACIHCGRPMNILDDFSEYKVTLNTHRPPFKLEGYTASGLCTRVQITDIDYRVNRDTLYIYVRAKRVYRDPATIRDQMMLQWTLRSPDRSESTGHYHMVDLALGESFEFQITETLYESGVYSLLFDID